MSENNKPEIKITVEELDGVTRKVVRGEKGDGIFAVDKDLTDEQVKEVYNLCDSFFQRGIKTGVMKMQADLHRMLGITPQLIKLLADSAESTEDSE